MPPPSWIGYTLGGRYRIDALLGQGGMSAVYRGTDPNLRRSVAIKLIHPHLAVDKEFVRRFEEEAASVAGLRHPNIVQVFDFNHDEDTYYMVLEFVTGQTLQEKLRALHEAGQRLPLPEVVRIMGAVCDAVQYAHEAGLIHRDIKPANVMINQAGQPVLMDFGVAKIMGGQQFTATGAVIGTPAYIAPELVRGQRPDPRADIYSLGVMLFEMLAGKLPFDADSAMTLMMMHLSDPVPDLRQLAPNVPEAFVAVVERALEKDPANRFQSAAEMVTALRLAASGTRLAPPARPGTASHTTPPASGTSRVTSPPGATLGPSNVTASQISAPPAPARRSNMGLLLGGAAVFGLCGIGLVVAVAGGFLLNQFGFGTSVAAATNPPSEGAPTEAAPTATAALVAQTATDPVVIAATDTEAPTLAPTNTETPAPTATHTLPPPTSTPATFFASITNIRIADGRYVVDFQTFNYASALPGMHIHLFFNTVPPSQAGSPGSGPWYVHGAGSPVSPYAVGERPGAATQMCILVANPDHTIILNSGNCVDLPQG